MMSDEEDDKALEEYAASLTPKDLEEIRRNAEKREQRRAETRVFEDRILGLVGEYYNEGGFQKNPNYFDLPRLLARLLDEHDVTPLEPSGNLVDSVLTEYVKIKARRNERAIRMIHDELVERGHVGEENALVHNDLDDRMFVLPAEKDHVRALCLEDQNCRFVVVSETHAGDGEDSETPAFGDIRVYRYWDVVDQTAINDRLKELEGKCPVLDAIARADWDVERWSDAHDQYSKRPPLNLFADWLMGGPEPDPVWVQPVFRWNVDPTWPDMRNGHAVPLHLCAQFFFSVNASCCELGIEQEALAAPYEKERA